MSSATPIDRLYSEATAVIDVLGAADEVSLKVAAADHFRKALLLAAASYFEQRVCTSVLDYVRQRASGSALVESFVRNKAINRQYHTWFQWEKKNANHFFGLFGIGFKSAMDSRVTQSDELRDAIEAFLEIGNERNKLVHQDYATFPMEKTLDEIHELYRRAERFVTSLPAMFIEGDALQSATSDT